MIPQPISIEQLASSLRNAAATGAQIVGWDLSLLPRSILHRADDLTVTVSSNITLVELQLALAPHRQWLPIDPPATTSPTIEQIISSNLSGSRRYGYGTIREQSIGITVMLPDGRVIRSGGQVVKNVAGFDLCKLFVGSQGIIGIILEATFKLRPLPESEKLFVREFRTLSEADAFIAQILQSPVTPILLDLHNCNDAGSWNIVIGFAGASEDVAWQADILDSIGRFRECDGGYIDSAIQRIPEIHRANSVLPSQLCAAIASLPNIPILAHAGNGVFRNGTAGQKSSNANANLLRRLVQKFDPAGVFRIGNSDTE